MSLRSALVLAGCMVPVLFVPIGAALELTGVRHRPQHIAEGGSSPITFDLELSEPAGVTLSIFDGRDVRVRALKSAGRLASGQHELAWDLRDELGRPVPAGAYHYRIDATGAGGTAALWDLTDTTGGDPVRNVRAALSDGAQSVRYQLPKPALVRIRIGLADNGPLLRTLVDWVPRLPGDQEEPWDGFDQSRAIRIADHERLAIQLDAVELPSNTIVVGRPATHSATIADLPVPLYRRPALERRYRMHDFLRQAMEARRDIPASIELPELRRDAAGRPIVEGTIPVRLALAPDDQRRLADERFEAVFFVDGLFAFEVESAYFPITWRWDAASATPGVHFLTANLRGYEGHFAIATIEVVVPEAAQGG